MAEFGPEDLAKAVPVSRETLGRLKIYAAMLEDWNSRHNLVSKGSLSQLWQRHFLDSAQLFPLIPDSAKSLVDLGSGAGFPGLVLAVLLKDRAVRTVLYEATQKKCVFLAAVAERLEIPVEIRNSRIELAKPEPFDIITARALAPLTELLPYAQRFWAKGSKALFLKGQNVEGELTGAHKSWRIEALRHPSLSDPSGTILEIRELKRV